MDTKTCSKCGWVVALHDPSNYCPVCGEPFPIRVCSICGKTFEYWAKKTMCKECYRKYVDVGNNEAMKRRRIAMYNEWLEKIHRIPKDYPPLTEEQWMEAVKHFGHCALCKNESIDTRGYFIPFEKGGRYCDWNVIPLCSECATTMKRNLNWFLSRKRPAGLTGIIDYLEVRVNAALEKSKNI